LAIALVSNSPVGGMPLKAQCTLPYRSWEALAGKFISLTIIASNQR
jgi:hypothetical protein